MNENFTLKQLYQNLDFMFPEFAWLLKYDHVYSNFDGLDILISLHHREGSSQTKFILNNKDVGFKFSDRDVRILSFNDLIHQIYCFENINKAHSSQQSWADILFGSNAQA